MCLNWIMIEGLGTMKPLSIYIHIPFCKSKCHYCDFLSAPAPETKMADYVAALLSEMEAEALSYQGYEVRTVFLGGGTPSVLAPGQIEAILCKLKDRFCFGGPTEPEITIEVNPGTITSVTLKKYQAAGINRISFGLQSADENELKLLGRIHTYEEFLSAYHWARNLGFENINIDLMSALPGQSFSSFKATLEKVAALEPEHISVYSLMLEPGTPFYEKYVSRTEKAHEIADEEEVRKIDSFTKSYLEAKNIKRYEISNYAKPGFFCRHNLTYWRRGDYVGFGLGAASMVDNKRWSNTSDLKSYIMIYRHFESANADRKKTASASGSSAAGKNISLSPKEKLQVLSIKEQMEEFMFLGLRLTQGVDINHFKNTFRCDIQECYGPVLRRLEAQNLIRTGENIRLTAYGTDISNYVLAQFLLD